MIGGGPHLGSPRVSVLITAWNAERFLDQALDSVFAQTRPAAEVIVTDDGSTDGTAAVVRRYGDAVTLIEAPHGGVSRGRNLAIERATGDLWAFLDADDLWRPQNLEIQVAALVADPSLDAVFCGTDEFVDDGGAPAHRAARLGVVGPLVSSLLIRAEAARRIGPFDATLIVGDWIDWWGRATQLGVRYANLPEVLADRRLHAHNNSVRGAANNGQYLRIIRDRLARGRAEP